MVIPQQTVTKVETPGLVLSRRGFSLVKTLVKWGTEFQNVYLFSFPEIRSQFYVPDYKYRSFTILLWIPKGVQNQSIILSMMEIRKIRIFRSLLKTKTITLSWYLYLRGLASSLLSFKSYNRFCNLYSDYLKGYVFTFLELKKNSSYAR